MAQPLTILHTGNLRGDLAILPRLHTFLRRLDTGGDALLLDTGGACSDAVWHCRATGGRSMLLALDAMGYQAANVDGALDANGREKLAGQVTLGLVDAAHDWRTRDGEILVALAPGRSAYRLRICLRAGDKTRLDGDALRLCKVEKGQVGMARVDLSERRLHNAEVHAMPSNTPPNPSIAGAVEFIESEARFFRHRDNPPRSPHQDGGRHG